MLLKYYWLSYPKYPTLEKSEKYISNLSVHDVHTSYFIRDMTFFTSLATESFK